MKAISESSQTCGRIFLRRGKDGPVRGNNPWIFSHAIERAEPADMPAGSMVEVRGGDGGLLGYGHYNPATTIAVRMLGWGGRIAPGEIIESRIKRAIASRARIIGADTDCYRLVNGDGDGLSGLVIDRYGDTLVIQLLSAGMDRMRDEIAAILCEVARPRAIIERSQGAVRRQEGLAGRLGPIMGEPSSAIVTENGIRIEVDLAHGQKTGCFLDQRVNRARFGDLARDARVLDLFCYSGGFTLAALRGGARAVTSVDTSERALGWARRNLELNGYAQRAELIHAGAAKFLADVTEKFDLIVLDPPPLARSREHAARAERLYIELNAMAMRALAPGGNMMTFSCSAHFRGEDFLRAVRIAQTRSGAPLRLLSRLGAGPDHPVLLGHIEGEYLTGFWLGALD
ncbi:MAG: class I SAM-dependent rRNA methyltransferase [Candidatus Binataceae bacterium]